MAATWECRYVPHGGGAPHRRLEPVSRRQPQYRRTPAGGPLDRGAGRGWLQLGNAGTFHTAAPQGRRNTAAVTTGRGRAFSRSQDGRPAAAQRARGNLPRKAFGSAPVSGDLPGGCRRQARLAHQLTLLGQFTAGFMHEFNNPLAIVTSRIEVL